MENMIHKIEKLSNDVLNDCVNTLRTAHEIIAKRVLSFLEELKQYRDAEEKGLLRKFPCNVGDTVYSYCSCFGILKYEVDSIVIDENGITYQCSSYSEPIGDCPSECLDEIEPDISDFGKTVFLTPEEVERALSIKEQEKIENEE